MRLVNNSLELPYGAGSLVIDKLSFKCVYMFYLKLSKSIIEDYIYTILYC